MESLLTAIRSPTQVFDQDSCLQYSTTPHPDMSSAFLLIIAFVVSLSASLELGENCDFADLCSLGSRNDSTCAVGQKFLIRGVKGVRRQFLVSNSSSLVMFLTRGVKVTDCSKVREMTSRLTCKVGCLVNNVKVLTGSTWLEWDGSISSFKGVCRKLGQEKCRSKKQNF